MLGVPSPSVDVGQVSGTVIKFWDTLKEIPDTSGATLAVSVAVIAIPQSSSRSASSRASSSPSSSRS